MRRMASLVGKEWDEHRWLLFNQGGFCLLCFALIYLKADGAERLSRGSFSLAFIYWPLFALAVANSLAFHLYTLESKERTSQFLAGLPIPRWEILCSKIGFSWCALMLVCLFYFGCTAAVSPQAQLNSWQSIFYPLVRLSAFNWFVITLVFLVSMIGKYRWYVYLIIIAIFIYFKNSGIAPFSLLKIIPAFRLVDEERALGDLSALPWSLINQTVGFGCIALVGILLADRLVQGFRLGDYFARMLTVSDRLVAALVILGIPALLVTITVARVPSKFDLEYHLAFEVDHQARSGSTLVELCYYKASPTDDSEEKLDQEMIEKIASILEAARRRLEPRWWPERWLVVKSPDVKNEAESWAKRVSGDAVIFVANWDSKAEMEKRVIVLSRLQLAYLLDSMMIGERHRDRHSWVTASLARALTLPASEKQKLKKKDVDLLVENSIDKWPGVVNGSKSRHVFGSALMGEIEKQLGEKEFNSWIREVGRWSLAKPEANTIFSLDRGGIFWRGLLQDSAASLERRGFDPEPVLEAMKNQAIDEK